MMTTLDNYGEILLQQNEGNRQIASAVAERARVLVRHVAKLLMAIQDRVPNDQPRR